MASYNRQNAFSSGVRLTIFDMVSFVVDLVPQGRPNKSKDSAMCNVAIVDGRPEAIAAQPVTSDGTAVDRYDLLKARETGDGTLVILDADAVIAAKVGDLEKDQLTVSVHPADQVERICRPGKGGYRLRPPAKASGKEQKLYAAIRTCVESHPDLAFVGSLRLRDTRAFYRLGVWGNQLVVQELVLPADLAAADVIDAEPEEATVAMAASLVAATLTDFDPADYYHDVLAAFDRAVSAAPAVAPTLTSVPDPSADMFELALAALAPPANKRAPRKPTTRKKVA